MKMILKSKQVECRGVETTAKGYFLIHVETPDGTPFTFFCRELTDFMKRVLYRGALVTLDFEVDSRYLNLTVVGAEKISVGGDK